VSECLVLEVADRELDHGVLAVLSVDQPRLVGAVGDEGEVAPIGERLGLLLLSVQVDAPDDQPLASQGGLRDLANARFGVVLDPLPGVIRDAGDPLQNGLLQGDADRVAAAPPVQVAADLLVPEGRLGAHEDLAARAAAADPGDQLLDEAQRASPGTRRSLAQADVQGLAAARASGDQRVTA
jgi:hypothetical protein